MHWCILYFTEALTSVNQCPVPRVVLLMTSVYDCSQAYNFFCLQSGSSSFQFIKLPYFWLFNLNEV